MTDDIIANKTYPVQKPFFMTIPNVTNPYRFDLKTYVGALPSEPKSIYPTYHNNLLDLRNDIRNQINDPYIKVDIDRFYYQLKFTLTDDAPYTDISITIPSDDQGRKERTKNLIGFQKDLPEYKAAKGEILQSDGEINLLNYYYLTVTNDRGIFEAVNYEKFDEDEDLIFVNNFITGDLIFDNSCNGREYSGRINMNGHSVYVKGSNIIFKDLIIENVAEILIDNTIDKSVEKWEISINPNLYLKDVLILNEKYIALFYYETEIGRAHV